MKKVLVNWCEVQDRDSWSFSVMFWGLNENYSVVGLHFSLLEICDRVLRARFELRAI